MSDNQLGQRVTFTDRLVRVEISEHSENVLQEAMDLMGISRKRGSTTHRGLNWKLWVPTEFARTYLHKGLVAMSSIADLGTAEGFITQQATLQQGGVYHSWSDPAIWMDHGTTRAYKIAYSLNRNPIHVLPEHIEPAA